ncbi:MAG: hypothetical protein COT25_02100 [Candidatus Kerfeldbacteria bacterium CG08_land_8_20_14_0_20_42_7]|uniref:Type II secretion system protein n=1 Tax=Candidatus Kerfeldbacteria bacterium CG08_land_8_20_14_0_20_42_7 TaxID=2014245 RepID=A0A2H0YTL4_9BACT|nr:MAG: hypothetical protein COT25_02100 [Candidatus Kerfeldbacteria bacterium CG08_land_8_20_14_0_20_42_7]
MIGDKHPKGFSLFETVVVLTIFSLAILLVVTIFSNASNSQRRQAISQKALGDARQLLNTLSQQVNTQRVDYNFYKGKSVYDDGGGTITDASCVTFEGDDQCNLLNPVSILALINDQGQRTRYWFDEANQDLLVCTDDPGVAPRDCKYNSGNYISVKPDSVSFTRVQFFINPIADPGYRGAAIPCSNSEACTCYRDSSPSGSGHLANDPVEGGCPDWTSGYCSATNYCAVPNAQPTVTTALEIEGTGLSAGHVRVPLQFTATSRIYDR